MRPSRIVLAAEVHAALLAANGAPDAHEPVAMLGGHQRGDTAHVAACPVLPNVAVHADRFAVEPAAFAAAEASLRACGLTWLGFAHGHRGGSAAPSCADRALLWRDCVQVVVGAEGVRAFWFAGEACLPLPIQVSAVPA
ncbi:MAG: Mov34/MPN/PAD-1 family protein [Planctomycetes bacterium]|nr:Mov34/MPN/PAD-1 family protein [Planctomycetota bacterium]